MNNCRIDMATYMVANLQKLVSDLVAKECECGRNGVKISMPFNAKEAEWLLQAAELFWEREK